MNNDWTHLRELESESIYILRETVAQFRNPVLLYSIGKDSSVLVHLARKAFYPGPLPFPFLHVDTGYKFKEMIEFRDRFCKEIGARLIVHRNEDAIAAGAHPLKLGVARCCGQLKTAALLHALDKHQFALVVMDDKIDGNWQMWPKLLEDYRMAGTIAGPRVVSGSPTEPRYLLVPNVIDKDIQ